MRGRTPWSRRSPARSARRSCSSPPARARPNGSRAGRRRGSGRTGPRSCRRGRRCPTRGSAPRRRSRRAGPRRCAGSGPPRARSSWSLPRSPRCRGSSPPSARSRRSSSSRGSSSRRTTWRSGWSRSGTRARTWSSTAASSRSAAACWTCSRGPRGARCGSSTGATRSSRSASSCRRRSCRPGRSPASRSRRCASSSPTTRWPNAHGRAHPATSTGSATGSSGSRRACTPRGSSRSRRCCSTGCRSPPSCCRRARGSWSRRPVGRSTARAGRSTTPRRWPRPPNWPGPRAIHDLDEALEGPRSAASSAGSPRASTPAWRDGGRRRATPPSSPAEPRSSPSAGTACC